MAVSNNFGEYLAKTYHGWFTERLKDLRTYLNQAFVNVEGGLKRNTIPHFCTGDSVGNWNAIVVDAISAQAAYVAAYQLDYGLGEWDICTNGKLYALEGITAQDNLVVIEANTGATFALVWAAATGTLTIKVPNNDSGTLAGLRAAFLAAPALADMFAVSGTDATAITTADVFTATAITEPAAWGTGLSAQLALAEVYFERLETGWAKIYLPADVTSGAFDALLPGTIHLEVWNDGQLLLFKHLAIAAAAE